MRSCRDRRERIEHEVKKRWQPQVRVKARSGHGRPGREHPGPLRLYGRAGHNRPERNDGSLLLVIENAGPTVARNVRISCNPPLKSGWAPVGDEPDLTQVIQQVMARTIPMLPPRRRLTFLLDSRERFKNTELPRVYTFTVNADGPAGAVETLEFTVDLDAVAWALLEDRPTKQLETKLGKIERAVFALSPGIARRPLQGRSPGDSDGHDRALRSQTLLSPTGPVRSAARRRELPNRMMKNRPTMSRRVTTTLSRPIDTTDRQQVPPRRTPTPRR